MYRKLTWALVLVAVGVWAAAAVAASGVSTRVTISTRESVSYKVNRYVQFGFRWANDVYTIKSGGTLVFKNNQTDEPHTFSIFKKGQRPLTTRQISACSSEPPALPAYAPCRALVQAHEPSPEGAPKNPVLNTGKPGIDGPGDSVFIPPKGAGPQPSIRVTAKPGTILYFVCLVHPWMQGKLVVK